MNANSEVTKKVGLREVEYLENAKVVWTTSLSSGKIFDTGLYKGNGILYSSEGDKNILYATTDNGQLHVLNAQDGSVVHQFMPPTIDGFSSTSRAFDLRGSGHREWFTQCSSQPALYYNNTDGDLGYIVYAVVDTPPLKTPSHSNTDNIEKWFANYTMLYEAPSEQSRIIAVNVNDGTLRWIETIVGVASGTPVIGEGGKFIYVTHNVDNKHGHITVLSDNNEEEVLNNNNNNSRIVYTRTSETGIFASLSKPALEYGYESLFWGETGTVDTSQNNQRGAEKLGYAKQNGRIHVIRDLRTISGNKFSSGVIKSNIAMTTISSPTVANRYVMEKLSSSEQQTSSGDLDLWMSGTKAAIVGWVGGLSLQKTFTYRQRVHASLRNKTMPIESSVTLHPYHQLIYASATSPSFYCLDSQTGDTLWKDEPQPIHEPYNPEIYYNRLHSPDRGTSVIRNEARISPDGKRIYTIRHNDGTLTSYDALSGAIQWKFSCRDLESNANSLCQSSVEAEFTISDNGIMVYYGDIYGTVTALQVSRHVIGTMSPTASLVPSLEPSIKPTASYMPSNKSSKEPSSIPTTSIVPSSNPIDRVSDVPSDIPSRKASLSPSLTVSESPSLQPTQIPTTHVPIMHSINPTSQPSNAPLRSSFPPSIEYTASRPSTVPTTYITSMSSSLPLPKDTINPTNAPSEQNILETNQQQSFDSNNGSKNDDAMKQIMVSGGLFLGGAVVGSALLVGAVALYCLGKKRNW
eukprot:CAMPEP_0194376272 /NCGR_PEP_ID=MMETSP0174-20130528/24701_1 /TAXON_ID=216777 /ORGANISM="Proboscia alata, Strain PI-D3" /LENGTH=745 /DNA_ID=CAMNT_0039156857 /DNA_START=463 /DNA_END=2697 /DNA_ORIENTATION=+